MSAISPECNLEILRFRRIDKQFQSGKSKDSGLKNSHRLIEAMPGKCKMHEVTTGQARSVGKDHPVLSGEVATHYHKLPIVIRPKIGKNKFEHVCRALDSMKQCV